MPSALQVDPVTETYLDVEKMIYAVVNEFHGTFGGDWDEYVAEANLTFKQVYDSYDPTKGALTNVLWTSIWRKLTKVNRKNIRSRAFHKVSLDAADGNYNTLAAHIQDRPDCTFDFVAFAAAAKLTEDAKTVIGLVLDPPEKVEKVAKAKGDLPMNWRSTLREYLRDIGWAAARISESFEEVREALK